eukprot:scaffold1982_cov93-Amphora_coffeaeformis.AAC.31
MIIAIIIIGVLLLLFGSVCLSTNYHWRALPVCHCSIVFYNTTTTSTSFPSAQREKVVATAAAVTQLWPLDNDDEYHDDNGSASRDDDDDDDDDDSLLPLSHPMSDPNDTNRNTSDSPQDKEEEKEEEDPLLVTPIGALSSSSSSSSSSLLLSHQEDWNFTEQELLAVLPSPDEDFIQAQESKPAAVFSTATAAVAGLDHFPSQTTYLPEIPISEQYWKNLRDNVEIDDEEKDWEHIFDNDNENLVLDKASGDNDCSSSDDLATTFATTTVSNNNTTTTTLELLAQLDNLQLQDDDNNNNNHNRHWMDQLTDQDEQDDFSFSNPPSILTPDGDIQPWLYCQPCETNDDAQIQSFLEPWKQPSSSSHYGNGGGGGGADIDHLLSQLAIYQPLDGENDNTSNNPKQTSHEETKIQQQQQHHPTSTSAKMSSPNATTATVAMQTLLQSFGITKSATEQGNSTTTTNETPTTTSSVASSSSSPPRPNRKLCLGHRERIMGVAMSANGLYAATAGADSTVRVWRNQRLLATLRGHDTEHECLRVAWASERWISAAAAAATSGSTTTTADRTPLTPSHDATVKSSVPTSVHEMAPPAILDTYWLATAGADGVVFLWTATTTADQPDPTAWRICATLDHTAWITTKEEEEEEPEKPQIYALSLIDDWHGLPSSPENEGNAFVLTSSDDHVHLWEWQADATNKKAKIEDGWSVEKKVLREVFSVHFGSWHEVGYGVTVGQVTGSALLDLPLTEDAVVRSSSNASADLTDDKVFGGTKRNPHGIVYVFDAAYSTALGCLGVALSDGTVRLLNGRGVCWSVLQLPHVRAHLTALSWSPTTNILATAVATGEVVTWQIWPGHTPICRAILAGGHEPGRPLFGVGFYGTAPPPDPNDPRHACQNPPPPEALVSWGIDGRLCVWEPTSEGNVEEPVATLVDDADYPLYAVAMCKDKLVAAGGGSDGGLIGIPVHLYTLTGPDTNPKVAAASSSSDLKKIPEEKETDEEKEDYKADASATNYNAGDAESFKKQPPASIASDVAKPKGEASSS